MMSLFDLEMESVKRAEQMVRDRVKKAIKDEIDRILKEINEVPAAPEPEPVKPSLSDQWAGHVPPAAPVIPEPPKVEKPLVIAPILAPEAPKVKPQGGK
jgi:hypothetical protein